ncbi:MAG: aminopeptidase P family protein [Firmicutes bacterium]|nr:aminopeptidase P family protein [Bacillota bacterium]
MESYASAEELQQRIDKLQAAMQQNSLAGALIIQRADLFYFSGTGQNGHLFVPASGEPTLLVKKTLSRARSESALKKIIAYNGTEQLKEVVASQIPEQSVIGVEADVLPAALYLRYKKIFAGYHLIDLSGIIREIRAVKSAYEINLMRQAAAVGKLVFDYAREIIKPGMSEVELAGQLELQARRHGHQGAVRMRGFNQELYFGHVLSGSNAAAASFFDGPTGGSGLNPSYPQGAGTKKIGNNEPILVDFVTVIGGYMVDQTRIFCLGSPATKLQEAYALAVEIKKTLTEKGKAGVCGSALYDLAFAMAEQAGLDQHFMGCPDPVSFVGHGVGIELDELPVIARGFQIELQKGMVFALEPKFIFPGAGTVGIEDTFVVGADNLEQLTDCSDHLQIL